MSGYIWTRLCRQCLRIVPASDRVLLTGSVICTAISHKKVTYDGFRCAKTGNGVKIAVIIMAGLLFTNVISANDFKLTSVDTLREGRTAVAVPFYGMVDGRMIIAGGSWFTGGYPWNGGVKSASDEIIEILRDDSGCIMSHNTGVCLPVGMYGGASTSDGKALYCIGGFMTDRVAAEYKRSRIDDSCSSSGIVYRISQNSGKFSVDSVAALPTGFIPSAATCLDGKIYVHGTRGGNNEFYSWHPSYGIWKELEAIPGSMVSEGVSIVVQHDGKERSIFLIGGRGMSSDGPVLSGHTWRYSPSKNKWIRAADFAYGTTMYAEAVPYGSSHILLFGGDDGKAFMERFHMEQAIHTAQTTSSAQSLLNSAHLADSLREVLRHAFESHKGFRDSIYLYHTITDTWTAVASPCGAFSVAGAVFKEGNDVLIAGGECRPGVRSSQAIILTDNDKVSFGWVNYTVLGLYLAVMMFVGFWFSRRAHSTDDFFKGGGKIPWWAAGISIFATALSAITFLSIPAKAYMDDWGMFMFNMAIVMVVPIVIHFYLPFFRKLKVASVYEYLEERFSPVVRRLASAFFCLFMFARVAIVLFLPSLALNAVTGLNIYLCIILMGVVTIIYCTMGGIEAVIWGDVIQGIILVGGAIISLVWLVGGVDGGLGEVMRIAIADEKFHILDFSFDFTKPVIWVTLLGGIANQLLTYTSDQSVVQRYLTVKDTKSSTKSLWFNGLLSIPIAILFFSIGTGLYVFFKMHPEMLDAGMSNTDSIYPHFIMCELPVGLAGLLIAAVFAAAMSTLSANINSTATVLTEDFYMKFAREAEDRKKLRFAKYSGMAIGGFGVIMAVALAMFNIASLWDQFNFFLGLLTSGLGGLFLMGIMTKRIGTKAALTGFVSSIVVLLVFHGYSNVSVILYGFIGLVSCFIFGWLSSFAYGYGK